MTTYASSGVNIELGDQASKILYEAAKKTWKNRQGKLGEIVEIFDDFSGLRAINVGSLPDDTFMNIGFDGVGTKMEIAERFGNHQTIAFDLFAMVCDDAVVRGAEPIIIGSILDINSLGKNGNSYIKFVEELADGYVRAAEAANVAVINGEMAELGARVSGYGDFNYNWGSGLVWFAKKDRMLTGKEIKAGDKIVSLREKGFRSNGLSLLRKVMVDYHGEDWHNQIFRGKPLAEQAILPSVIYSKAVCQMFGGFADIPRAEIHGVSHITGGGIPGKLGRVLRPSGLGANLDNLFEPGDLMLHAQEIGEISDEEAYRTWNMGQGMLVITPEPEKVISIAQENNIEAQISGKVVQKRGVTIKNRGFFNEENPELVFKPE